MHGCARGPPPEGRWGGRSNPPLFAGICHGETLLFSILFIVLCDNSVNNCTQNSWRKQIMLEILYLLELTNH